MDPKNVVHDGKKEFIGINSFLTGPVIVSNKNWNIPIKWEVVIAFWNSAIICLRETLSFLPFLLCNKELDSFYFHHAWCKPHSPCMVKIWFIWYMLYFHHKCQQVLHHDYHGENKILCRVFFSIWKNLENWMIPFPLHRAKNRSSVHAVTIWILVWVRNVFFDTKDTHEDQGAFATWGAFFARGMIFRLVDHGHNSDILG